MRGRFYYFLILILFAVFAVFFRHSPIQERAPSISHIEQVGSLIIEPDNGIAPIVTAIAGAKMSIDLVIYELDDVEVERALAAASARKVSVRVILNNQFGKNHANVNQAAYLYLESHSVSVHWSSTHVAITHQKTLIIDRTRAYILTFNFRPKYYASGRDFGVVDSNTLDIKVIESVFETDWNDEVATIPFGENLVWSPGAQEQFLSLIQHAQKSITIYAEEMGYHDVVSALSSAVKRGVAVRILMTQSDRWTKTLETLSTDGIEVRQFNSKSPLYIHAKVLIVDDSAMILGSQNYSYYSMRKNRELSLFTQDANVIEQVKKVFESDWILSQK